MVRVLPEEIVFWIIGVPVMALALMQIAGRNIVLSSANRRVEASVAAFAGLIGSKTKWARFRSRLAALGHSPGAIARITCPIGDPELGKHPQMIAVGVAAQLLRHGKEDEQREDRRA